MGNCEEQRSVMNSNWWRVKWWTTTDAVCKQCQTRVAKDDRYSEQFEHDEPRWRMWWTAGNTENQVEQHCAHMNDEHWTTWIASGGQHKGWTTFTYFIVRNSWILNCQNLCKRRTIKILDRLSELLLQFAPNCHHSCLISSPVIDVDFMVSFFWISERCHVPLFVPPGLRDKMSKWGKQKEYRSFSFQI